MQSSTHHNMATSLRIQELLKHIGYVYPQKVSERNKKLDEVREITRVNDEKGHVVPLDLVDVRKEQSRLAALLNIESRDPNFIVPPGITNRASRRSWFICSLQSVEKPLDSYISLPTSQKGLANPQLSSSPSTHDYQATHAEFIDTLRSVGGGTFRLPVVDGPESSDRVVKRFQRDRFKLPPVFDGRGRKRGVGIGGVGARAAVRGSEGRPKRDEFRRDRGFNGGTEGGATRVQRASGAVVGGAAVEGATGDVAVGRSTGGAFGGVPTREGASGGGVTGRGTAIGRSTGGDSVVGRATGGDSGGDAALGRATRGGAAVGKLTGRGATDEDNASISDKGRLLALTSDKTFMSVTVGVQSKPTPIFLSSSSESYNKTPLLTRISKPVLPRINDDVEDDYDDNNASWSGRQRFLSGPNMSSMKQKSRKRQGLDLGSYSGVSGDVNSFHSGTLRYHHRQGSDIIFAPQNSLDGNFKDQDVSRSEVSTSTSSLDFDDSSPFNTRGTTFCESPNSLVASICSESWCRCTEVDLNRLRCSECLKIGGHQRWCVSKLGLCSSCGKAVKSTMDVVSEINLARPPTVTTKKSSRSLANTATNDRIEHNLLKPQSSELKVRFSGTDEIRSISPLESDTLHGELVEDVYQMKPEVYIKGNYETKAQLKNVRKPVVPLQQSFEVDLHKKAYELALSDSRVHKLKKSKNIKHSLSHSVSGTLFSYFPRWKQATSKSISSDSIGLKDPDVNIKKIKIKKGMKHILGKIKIEDYYGTLPKRKIMKT